MSTDRISATPGRLWLVIGAIFTVVAIGVLWPLQQVGQICPLIYPAPPGCGAPEPRWVPLVAIALVIAALAGQVVVFVTVPRRRPWLVVLCGAMLAVVAIALVIVGISQTGVWDPYQPPIIID
jgi:hypothetical protein